MVPPVAHAHLLEGSNHAPTLASIRLAAENAWRHMNMTVDDLHKMPALRKREPIRAP